MKGDNRGEWAANYLHSREGVEHHKVLLSFHRESLFAGFLSGFMSLHNLCRDQSSVYCPE